MGAFWNSGLLGAAAQCTWKRARDILCSRMVWSIALKFDVLPEVYDILFSHKTLARVATNIFAFAH